MVRPIKEVLMHRDGISEEEADDLIEQAKEDLRERLEAGEGAEDPAEICMDWFGLEPDYLEELTNNL